MQVRNLRRRLDPALRVGSVDKFQGQEAAVVVVSMCSSTLEDCPRGAEFLLSPNRLNVAVSRAKAVAVVVGSPGLMAGRCSAIEEMRQVNLLCRLAGGRRRLAGRRGSELIIPEVRGTHKWILSSKTTDSLNQSSRWSRPLSGTSFSE
jgi:hypothetical protein